MSFFSSKLAAHVAVAIEKRAENMKEGPAVPKIGKPPSVAPVSPPKPPTAFKPITPKFMPDSLKNVSGATSGTIT